MADPVVAASPALRLPIVAQDPWPVDTARMVLYVAGTEERYQVWARRLHHELALRLSTAEIANVFRILGVMVAP